MPETFKEFIETEIRVMLDEMDESVRGDIQQRRTWELDWVAKHTAEFRTRWEQSRRAGALTVE